MESIFCNNTYSFGNPLSKNDNTMIMCTTKCVPLSAFYFT